MKQSDLLTAGLRVSRTLHKEQRGLGNQPSLKSQSRIKNKMQWVPQGSVSEYLATTQSLLNLFRWSDL